MTMLEHLMARVQPHGSCLLVTSVKPQPNGYTRISYQGTREYAHRFAWVAYGGILIPGHDIDHVCHVAHQCVAPCLHRRCVAQAHLDQVSHGDNQRRTLRLLAPEGRRTCRHGHDLTLPDAIQHRQAGPTCKICNRERARRSYWKAAA